MRPNEVYGKSDAVQPPAFHPFFPPKVGKSKVKEVESQEEKKSSQKEP